MPGIDKIRIAVVLVFLLGSLAIAQSASPHDGGGEGSSYATSSAISVSVSSTADDSDDIESVIFDYVVFNRGSSKLCNITVNNSLSGIGLLETFDLGPGENRTLTAKYNITLEDRQYPFLANEVRATGFSCETGERTASAIAVNSIKITSFGE